MKNQRGITLIALVITIVILIILAAVAINMTLGENGILEKAKYAKEQYEIAGVREEIELAILEIQSDKASKNEDFSIEAILAELPSKVEGITLEKEGNSLKGSFNGYNFTINESMKLAIEGESIEVAVVTEVKQYIGKDANGKYAVKVLLTLNSEDTIDTVKIENTDGSTTEETIGNKTYSKEIELELDKEYRINIESENGAKTAKKIQVASITNISNVDQFVAFRDSVNSGLTYEGATINLTTDLDLSRVCYKVDGTTTKDVSWEPIGNTTNPFKGTFNGNYKTIKNLYINSSNSHQGLFGYGKSTTIKKVIIDENSKINGNEYVGGIIGRTQTTSTIEECGNNGVVNGKVKVGGICGATQHTNIKASYNKGKITGEKQVGGITGYITNDNASFSIQNCYNTGYVYGREFVGGIVGDAIYSRIFNCYNKGKIEGENTSSGSAQIGGIIGRVIRKGITEYCYNIGNVNYKTNAQRVGGIMGENNSWNGTSGVEENKSTVSYCYNSADVTANEKNIGGIIGLQGNYCLVNNCYLYSNAKIQYNGIDVTNEIGTSENNYLGKILGNLPDEATQENNGILDEMPTVYYVVNGLSDGESEYWSNSNPDQPKLLWEK